MLPASGSTACAVTPTAVPTAAASDTWLAAPEEGQGLPADRAALIADWQAWLADGAPL